MKLARQSQASFERRLIVTAPNPTAFSNYLVLSLLVCLGLVLSACGKTTKAEAESSSTKVVEVKKPASKVVPMWLGNPERNFFGTGPWTDKPLEVAWDFKTGWVRGRLHPDPWGGSGWPGQVAVVGDCVYFQSADSYVYCQSK